VPPVIHDVKHSPAVPKSTEPVNNLLQAHRRIAPCFADCCTVLAQRPQIIHPVRFKRCPWQVMAQGNSLPPSVRFPT
jgi:hypothetical protein